MCVVFPSVHYFLFRSTNIPSCCRSAENTPEIRLSGPRFNQRWGVRSTLRNLMLQMTAEEADRVALEAAEVSSIERVVQLFEIVNAPAI